MTISTWCSAVRHARQHLDWVAVAFLLVPFMVLAAWDGAWLLVTVFAALLPLAALQGHLRGCHLPQVLGERHTPGC